MPLAALGQLLKDLWKDLPSPGRRAWEAASEARWPRYGAVGAVTPLDTYLTADERYYSRRGGYGAPPRWSVTEGNLTRAYARDYRSLPDSIQEKYKFRAEALNHARGFNGQRTFFLPMQPQPGNNGPRPDEARVTNDILAIPAAVGNIATHTWVYGARLGSGGFGTAVVYRQISTTHRITDRRVVLKKDIVRANLDAVNIAVNDRERRLLRRVRALPQNQGSKHIVRLIASRDWTGPRNSSGQPGRTWLEYAAHGDLRNLIQYYQQHEYVDIISVF
ncbi:hypothetical protein MPH_04260 [Macrophomina phaseolina MS6]|uniref:Protein kinase domain-containing protein n=1 Tax=Macrophomina phaseolina (strain MS6) TaxID=1126212 RepID=K2RUJ7_MACPH|nr:hypothetical protein MPH_04260 [Macrophomina phaseolina MS6]